MLGRVDIPKLGTFSTGRITQNSGTAIVQLVPPYQGPAGSAPLMYTYQGSANWLTIPGVGVPHVTTLSMLCGSTAHIAYIMRPKAFTYFTAALPVSTTAIPNATLKADPGAYSTGYLYPLPSGVTAPNTADNTIATSDYVCYQLSDGSWQVDKIASGTFGASLALTTGTPSTATIPKFSPLFWFGAAGDTDPQNNQIDPAFDTIVSVRNTWQDYIVGIAQAAHPGDPLLFYDANASAADFLNTLSGYYGMY